MSDSYLNIHAQDSWHGDAYIIGNVRALTDLRDAIDRALQKFAAPHGDARQVMETMVYRDGEGYFVRLAVIDDPDTLGQICLPYTWDVARGDTDGLVDPADLFADQIKAEAEAVRAVIAERNRQQMLKDHGPFCGPKPEQKS